MALGGDPERAHIARRQWILTRPSLTAGLDARTAARHRVAVRAIGRASVGAVWIEASACVVGRAQLPDA
jgi:hypothetical protein